MTESKQITFEIEVGRLYCTHLRNFLTAIKVVYKREITWVEGDGFLSRPFWITTDELTASVIKGEIDRLSLEKKEQEESEEAERKERKWWQFWK
jgi:hypothetical protein